MIVHNYYKIHLYYNAVNSYYGVPFLNPTLMLTEQLIYCVAYPGWIVGVSRHGPQWFHCWIINPELAVLTDGECHPSGDDALDAGRFLVEHSLEIDVSQDHG